MYRSMVIAIGAAMVLGSVLAHAQQPGQTPPPASPRPTLGTPPNPSQNQNPQQPAQPKADAPALNDLTSQASYGFGLNVGQRLKEQSEQLEMNPRLVARGIVDGLTDAQPLMTEEQIMQVMQQFEQQLLARQMEANEGDAEQNKAEGEAFLAANKDKEGVQTTESGLQYKVLEKGDGASPDAEDTVTINYKGTLLDGTVFDSTEDREPLTFPLANFIDGWKEALQLMQVGDKWQVFIPSDLAYGETGTPGGPIPPNATLVFEIELLDVQK